MGGTHVAFLRGINVGRAKRVAMSDLRTLVGDLGYSDVRTVLNSGNIIFTAPAPGTGVSPGQVATLIEEAIFEQIGVSAAATVLTAEELVAAVAGNPLLEIAVDHSRLLVSVLANPADRARLEPLLGQDWAPEALSLGSRVAYQWCPAGVLACRVHQAVGRILENAVTTRNWKTILKLHELMQD